MILENYRSLSNVLEELANNWFRVFNSEEVKSLYSPTFNLTYIHNPDSFNFFTL